MNNWKETTLGKVCSKIGSGATPRGGQDSYKEDGIALIRSQNVLDLDFNYSGLAFIDQEQADDLANVEVQKEDVLINITGDSVARVCMVPDAVLPARVNQHVSILRANSADLDPSYLKYYLINRSIKQSLLIIANSGATRNALTKGQLENFPIRLPALPEQKAIAAILSSFDDKIELLRRQNKTLESIAQTIFKEWFIHFKIKNQKLKIKNETGLPEGWRMGKLGETTKIVYGKNLPTDNLTQDGYPVFGGNGQIGSYSEFLYEDQQVLISCRGEASGKVNISLPKSFVTNNSLILEIPDESAINFCFLKYFSLNTDFTNYVSGSAQPQITIESIKDCPILLPTEEILSAIQEMIRPIEDKILCNFYQIQTLSSLRDALLPKLMKGEIRVKG